MKRNLREWMKGIDDEVDLFSLSIPGTHDSATKYVQLSRFTKCQDLSIYEQLCIGIRSLDIRVASKDDRLVLVHGIAKAFGTPSHFGKQLELSEVLEHCYRFLSENPSEAIVFQFKNDDNSENEKCFNNLFYGYISGNEDKWYLEARVPTLAEARGRLVLLRRCRLDESNKDFTTDNTGIDFSGWAEQDKIVPDALPLETHSTDNAVFLISDRYNYKPRQRWSECTKPFLDSRGEFDGQYVMCYLSTAGGMLGPEKNAKYINSRFVDYPIDKNKYYGTIYMDFPSEELTQKIINHNFSD